MIFPSPGTDSWISCRLFSILGVWLWLRLLGFGLRVKVIVGVNIVRVRLRHRVRIRVSVSADMVRVVMGTENSDSLVYLSVRDENNTERPRKSPKLCPGHAKQEG